MRSGHRAVKRICRARLCDEILEPVRRCGHSAPNGVRIAAPTDVQGAKMAEKLNTGDTFPSLALQLVGGGTMTVPGDLDSKYKVILFYRGHW